MSRQFQYKVAQPAATDDPYESWGLSSEEYDVGEDGDEEAEHLRREDAAYAQQALKEDSFEVNLDKNDVQLILGALYAYKKEVWARLPSDRQDQLSNLISELSAFM